MLKNYDAMWEGINHYLSSIGACDVGSGRGRALSASITVRYGPGQRFNFLCTMVKKQKTEWKAIHFSPNRLAIGPQFVARSFRCMICIKTGGWCCPSRLNRLDLCSWWVSLPSLTYSRHMALQKTDFAESNISWFHCRRAVGMDSREAVKDVECWKVVNSWCEKLWD